MGALICKAGILALIAAAFLTSSATLSLAQVRGNGTAGQVPVWVRARRLSNSSITQNSDGSVSVSGDYQPTPVTGTLGCLAVPTVAGRLALNNRAENHGALAGCSRTPRLSSAGLHSGTILANKKPTRIASGLFHLSPLIKRFCVLNFVFPSRLWSSEFPFITSEEDCTCA